MISVGDAFGDELFIGVPQDQLTIYQQNAARRFFLEFRFEPHAGPPKHHSGMLESPVDADPARLPGFENDVIESLDVPDPSSGKTARRESTSCQGSRPF